MLRDLSSLVGAVAEDIRLANRMTAKLDFALAGARYARRLDAVRPELATDAQNLRLVNLRHPLLGTDAVPLTVSVGPGWSALVITGPNTGGKTVAMKNVGLAALMHQSGLQIPAEEGSALPVFEGVFADIGDSQSIADSVSTFGSHIRSVIDILRHAGPRSLALLDELGTSTDPEEGSALAKAIIAHLARKKATTIVTTHHRNVAAFAEASEDMMKRQLPTRPAHAGTDLSYDDRRPRPELRHGGGGTSRTFQRHTPGLARPHGAAAPVVRGLAERTPARAASASDEPGGHLADKGRGGIAAPPTRRAGGVSHRTPRRYAGLSARGHHGQVQGDQSQAGGAEASLQWAVPESASATATPTRDRIERIRRDLAAVEPPTPAPVRRRKRADRPLAAGDTVFIRGMNLQGRIIAMPDGGEDVEVSVGRVRVNVDLHRLSRVEESEPESAEPETPSVKTDLAPSLDSLELDLRGLRVDDAQIRLDEFVDHAMRDGLSRLRVIHGRGTGALRNVVREHLRHHRAVRNFGPEPRERGGNGATWIELS